MPDQPLLLQHWPQQPGKKLRLFCFPFAGGGASAYYQWVAALAPEIAVTAIQLPGRESRLREAPVPRLAPVVQAIADSIGRCSEGQFAFFGHSMGTVLAFETARTLRRKGLPQPAHLFVSGRQAPHLPLTDCAIHALPDSLFLEECIRRYDGIPKPILAEPELVKLLLPALRADVELVETYEYAEEDPLQCPITAMHGRDDRSTEQLKIQSWSVHSEAVFRFEEFPGGHFFLQTAKEEVLGLIRRTFASQPEGPRN